MENVNNQYYIKELFGEDSKNVPLRDKTKCDGGRKYLFMVMPCLMYGFIYLSSEATSVLDLSPILI